VAPAVEGGAQTAQSSRHVLDLLPRNIVELERGNEVFDRCGHVPIAGGCPGRCFSRAVFQRFQAGQDLVDDRRQFLEFLGVEAGDFGENGTHLLVESRRSLHNALPTRFDDLRQRAHLFGQVPEFGTGMAEPGGFDLCQRRQYPEYRNRFVESAERPPNPEGGIAHTSQRPAPASTRASTSLSRSRTCVSTWEA